MCYPCVNCGKCGSKLPEAKIRCPKSVSYTHLGVAAAVLAAFVVGVLAVDLSLIHI